MNLDWFRHTGEKWPRHHRPPLDLVRHLSEHAVGARKEAYTPEAVYDRAYECDMTSGYAAQCDVLPSGTVGLWNGNVAHREILKLLDERAVGSSNIKHWWGRCYVKIHRELPPGDIAPFAVRDDEGELSWPTKPAEQGGWWTYLWEFEAEEIQKRFREDGSMEVLAVEWAYTWTTETTQLSGWAETMDRMRHQAERELTPIVGREEAKVRAGLVKLLIVAGIGRLGVPYETTTVLPESEAREGDVLVQSEVIPYTGLVARKEFQDMGTPMHWHKWVLSKMNYAMYRKHREEWQAGNTPIYMNVDGSGWLNRPAGTVAREVAMRGDMKEKEYIYLSAPAAGQILAVDTNGETKVALPGMAKTRQQALLRGRLYRIGERKAPQSRGELLSEQNKGAFLDALHAANWRTICRVDAVRSYLATSPPEVATG